MCIIARYIRLEPKTLFVCLGFASSVTTLSAKCSRREPRNRGSPSTEETQLCFRSVPKAPMNVETATSSSGVSADVCGFGFFAIIARHFLLNFVMPTRLSANALFSSPISSSLCSSSISCGVRVSLCHNDANSDSSRSVPMAIRLIAMKCWRMVRSAGGSAAPSTVSGGSSVVRANVVRCVDRQMKGPGLGLKAGLGLGIRFSAGPTGGPRDGLGPGLG
mmetsp:Transcript_149438/g.261062  ORF Transcript_149438/g.261062 Transcript_149438/m.261062 type:complete len:219 (-) Transcript_149438:662-1318(-)